MEKVNFRTQILSRHLQDHGRIPIAASISSSPCLNYTPPEVSEQSSPFDVNSMRKLMDGHNLEDRDWLFNLMIQSELFNPKLRGGKVFVVPDYNQSMEQQREITMKRIQYLLDHGVFKGWLTGKGFESEMRKLALLEVIEIFDHSLAIKIGVHFFLWYRFCSCLDFSLMFYWSYFGVYKNCFVIASSFDLDRLLEKCVDFSIYQVAYPLSVHNIWYEIMKICFKIFLDLIVLETWTSAFISISTEVNFHHLNLMLMEIGLGTYLLINLFKCLEEFTLMILLLFFFSILFWVFLVDDSGVVLSRFLAQNGIMTSG